MECFGEPHLEMEKTTLLKSKKGQKYNKMSVFEARQFFFNPKITLKTLKKMTNFSYSITSLLRL